jgi:hypothetical protein
MTEGLLIQWESSITAEQNRTFALPMSERRRSFVEVGSCITDRGWSGSALNPKTKHSPSIQEIRIRGCGLNP